MINKIVDLDEAWEEKRINLFPIPYKTKKQTSKINGKSSADYWNTQYPSLKNLKEDISNKIYNLGLIIGYDENNNGFHLGCIDIDAYKTEDEEDRLKTAELIFKAIRENFEGDFFTCKTASGAYHLYFFTSDKIQNSDIDFLDLFSYPEESEYKGITLKDNNRHVEVFCKPESRYIAVPPSKTEQGTYEILEDEVRLLEMKPVTDVKTKLFTALEKSDFILNKEELKELEVEENEDEYNIIDIDADRDQLTENILNCYRKGCMNLFGWALICNFRRGGFSENECYKVFIDLSIDQNLKEVRGWIKDKYSKDINEIAGFNSLKNAIIEHCEEGKVSETIEFFTRYFKKGTKGELLKLYEEYDSNNIFVRQNSIFIKYNSTEWKEAAILSMKLPPKTEEKHLRLLSDFPPEDQYLVCSKFEAKWYYAWTDSLYSNTIDFSDYDVEKRIVKERILSFNKFLVSKNKKGNWENVEKGVNSAIGRNSVLNEVPRCSKSISLFLADTRGKLKENYDEVLKCIAIVDRNEVITKKIRDYNLWNLANNDTKMLLRSDKDDNYLANDFINCSMYMVNLTQKPDGNVTHKSFKDIANFCIYGMDRYKDIKDSQEYMDLINLGFFEHEMPYEYDDVGKFVKHLLTLSGVALSSEGDLKKAVNTITGHLLKNKLVKYKKYSSKDGIFYDHEAKQFTYTVNKQFINIDVKDEEVKISLENLKRFFEITSIRDKSKISELFRWVLFSPLSYSYKELRENAEFFPYLVLQGEKKTGKSTLMEMFRKLYRDDNKLEASSHGRSKHQFASLLARKRMVYSS